MSLRKGLSSRKFRLEPVHVRWDTQSRQKYLSIALIHPRFITAVSYASDETIFPLPPFRSRDWADIMIACGCHLDSVNNHWLSLAASPCLFTLQNRVTGYDIFLNPDCIAGPHTSVENSDNYSVSLVVTARFDEYRETGNCEQIGSHLRVLRCGKQLPPGACKLNSIGKNDGTRYRC